ncbi:MAG: methionyl-tRNA formyltransferase [Patescibacteria group bacterium]
MIHDSIPFVFFGTPELSAEILEHLKCKGLVPSLIVTNPDRPQGRKLVLTPPPVKIWAIKNNIPFLQPENLLDPIFLGKLSTISHQLFVVVAYGKIIPKEILAIPSKGTLNIHYSLLPKYRGASPIESQILNDDRHTGISILLLDEKMDHGPIVATRDVSAPHWPPTGLELRAWSNKVGGELLAEIIPLWAEGKIMAKDQDHTLATYAPKIEKSQGEINFSDDPYKNFLKIQAFAGWPGTFFFVGESGQKKRILITDASYENNLLVIKKVVPEGKSEMSYTEFKGAK